MWKWIRLKLASLSNILAICLIGVVHFLLAFNKETVMKKILLIALVLVSTSAMAERMVTGESSDDQGRPTTSTSRPEACDSAKKNAKSKKAANEDVKEYGKCDCDGKPGAWSCIVNAQLINM